MIWGAWIALILGCLLIIWGCRQDRSRNHDALRQTINQPRFPSDFFMPYTVCPKCQVEALHWLRAPRPSFREDKFSCIRTCREPGCGFTWGQYAGLDYTNRKIAA